MIKNNNNNDPTKDFDLAFGYNLYSIKKKV